MRWISKSRANTAWGSASAIRLGPGGVFRGLRTIPVLLDMCDDMDDLAPDALLLNYVNPMAMNCWAVSAGSGPPACGAVPSVQGTTEMLAKWAGVPYEEVNFVCAGHQSPVIFLQFRRGQEDLYPRSGRRSRTPRSTAHEPVRIDMMKYFGYFVTESSGHATEYAPYFRKNAKMIEEELVPLFKNPDDLLVRLRPYRRIPAPLPESRCTHGREFQALIDGTRETCAWCAVTSTAPKSSRRWRPMSRPNQRQRAQLRADHQPARRLLRWKCPAWWTPAAFSRSIVGDLPPQLAALNRTGINVQDLVVEAASPANRRGLSRGDDGPADRGRVHLPKSTPW